MQHVSAIFVALLLVGVVLGITLGAIGGASMAEVVMATIAIVAIAYPIGDLLILPATNNVTGIAADAAVAAVVLWLMAPSARGGVLIASLLGLGIGLYFYHLYLYQTVLAERTVIED